MNYLFEDTKDILTSPYEAFIVNTRRDPFPVRPHWHYFMEILYILEGTALIECDQKTYILEPGETIFFYPAIVHSIYTSSNVPLSYAVIKFDINRLNVTNSYTPKLRSTFYYAKGNEHAPIHLTKDLLHNNSLENHFICCIDEINHKEYGYDLRIHSELCSLLIKIIRLWRNNGFHTDIAKDMPEINIIYTITEYIDSHSHESIKVEDIASYCNMSYSYFAKVFKQIYGRSCKDYIDLMRICKVEDFLMFTDYDLNHISQETGFSDCSHLIKTFKKWKQVTPKQYRRNQGK